jgi:hypothetical protein
MANPPRAPLDDNYSVITINDFSGGMVTIASPLVLGSNQSPSILNCIPLPGRLQYRGGTQNICDLPANPDAAYEFFDSNGGKHYVVWAGGSLYDCVTGVAVAIENAVYTAGQRIGVVDYNGSLYWSTGMPNPVPIRIWTPSTGAKGAVVSTGPDATPASDFLFLYTNAIVCLAPYWPGSGTYQPNVFAWAGINNPSYWNAASSQAVGALNNGRLEFAMPFGISAEGVQPFENIIVGRNDLGIFAYSGALGSFHEALLNCPFGVRDRDTVQYLPTDGMFGTLVYLATDGQVWGTNGINCAPISGNILNALRDAYRLAIANDPKQRFFSGYNQQWNYYWLDIAGTQFVYRWEQKAWAKFQGWPSGPSFNAIDGSGAPANFIAARGGNYLAQVGVIGIGDNGAMPNISYTTPVLHGGDWNRFKEFHWGAIATYDTGAKYQMAATSIKRSDNSQMVATSQTMTAPGQTGTPFIVGQSLLGGPDVLGGVAPGGSGTPVIMQGRFAVPIPADEWFPQGHNETLKGNGAQLTISYAGGAKAFDLLGVEVLYVPRGYRRGSGTSYNPEDLTGQPFDPFVVQ